jgi:hypothetical protein
MGPCIVSIFQYTHISNKMQSHTVCLYLETVLHVSGGTSTHHEDRIQLYLQHLVFFTPLLLSAAIVEELEPVWVCCGWRRPDINKLCNVASCWIYIGILLGAHPILRISRIRVNNIKYIVLRIHIIYEAQLSLPLHLKPNNEVCFKILYGIWLNQFSFPFSATSSCCLLWAIHKQYFLVKTFLWYTKSYTSKTVIRPKTLCIFTRSS